MLRILLPQLSSHRKLQRATLADAWRLRDGQVSVERMINAWRTSLRGASHLARGATLIEELVAMAERRAVQLNARWALKQIDFSADQLETALDLLIRYDGTYRDRTLALVGEHATSMDTLQWVFMPARPGETPTLNMERAKSLFEWAMEPGMDLDAAFKALAELGPDGIQQAIDATNEYYRELARLMRIGYPEVRASDVAAASEKYIHTNIWTELLFPNLTRIYQLRARDDAARRATQLTFAVHLYKARHGRWPDSLDELFTATDATRTASATRSTGATRAIGSTGAAGSTGATEALHRTGATGGLPASANIADATAGLPRSGATDALHRTGATGGLPASADHDRIRTDPFTGKDFGYRVSPDGPTIYSLSENAQDDGGVHSPRWDDEITSDVGSDDYVFWPPQQRRPRR